MNANNKTVRLGFAEVDITPSVSVELVGFDRLDNSSRGIRDKLIAQILLWDDSFKKTCIVCIDSLGFTVQLSNSLRQAVANELLISREDVMLCFSHTHAAPNAAQEKAYFDFVCAQILEGVDQAIQTLVPVNAAWGIAQADIGVNRRNENGLLDKRIGVLKVVDVATKQLKLILLRVTAHANVLSSDNYLISSDYFGATRQRLEDAYGCKVVMTQGASGNVRPKFQHSMAELMEIHPREAMEKVNSDILNQLSKESTAAFHKMSNEVHNAVGAVLDNLIPEPIYRVDMFSETKTFFADVPTINRANEIAEEAKKQTAIDGASWLSEVERLHKDNMSRQNTEIEIQYFVLNDGCLCGIANEVMCEIALDISKRCSHDRIFFGGYTNGIDGYLSTEEEYKKGGYEILWSYLIYYRYFGRVMPLNCDTADKLAHTVTDKWNQINHNS
ncbi:alkaline ceramidase [Oscillospiraceae bacterium PP1C4]